MVEITNKLLVLHHPPLKPRNKNKRRQRKKHLQFDKFSEADAEYAVNQLTDIDWNKVALKKAESYVKSVGIAKSKLADQLTQFDGFTQEEADYAVANIKADFNEAAAKKAKSYQKTMNMSSAAIHDQLIQFDGFTEEEVNYAISKLQ